MSLIDSFLTDVLSVKRFGPGEWLEGVYVRGELETVTIKASIQPMSPSEVLQLPEHRRNRETVKVYTDKRLNIAEEASGKAADIIEHDGKQYEVLQCSNWSINTDLPHYKCIGVMIDGEPANG